METFIKADIFFFVTTIVAIVMSIFLGIVLYYAIIVLKRILHLCDIVEKNIDTASAELKEIVFRIKDSFIFNVLFTKKKKSKK